MALIQLPEVTSQVACLDGAILERDSQPNSPTRACSRTWVVEADEMLTLKKYKIKNQNTIPINSKQNYFHVILSIFPIETFTKGKFEKVTLR